MTDYERDKEYERSEWWRVPLFAVSHILFLPPIGIAIFWAVGETVEHFTP